jgi:hypothetical protein
VTDSTAAASVLPEHVFARLPRGVQAALLRIGRRVQEGFEGEIALASKRGGILYIRWTQTETGDAIKEELGGW